MGNGLYGIAVSGLQAAQIGLTTTSHNIANASTPGYTRQTIKQSAVDPLGTGQGFLGRGVQIDTVNRSYNEFLVRQMQGAQAQSGYYDNLQSHLEDLDNLLADPAAGFSPSLQDFFTGVQTVANDPKNVSSRQSLLGLSQAMITKLQTVNSRITTLRNDVNQEVTATVGNINGITQQIAAFNEQITLARNGANGNEPNDLLDQRDQLVTRLNQYVKSTVIKQNDGSYNVFIGNGQNLVVGGTAFTLAAIPAADDPARFDVAYQQYGATSVIPSSLITGGSLGGVLQYRRDVLDNAQSAIGRVAMALGQSVNTQHKLGSDLNGQLGGNFFQFPMERINEQGNIGVNKVKLSASNLSTEPFVSSDFNVSAVPDPAGGPLAYLITRLTDGQTVTASSAEITGTDGYTAFGINFRLTASPTGTTADMVLGETIGVSFLPAASHVIPNNQNQGNATVQVSIADTNKLSAFDYTLYVDQADDPTSPVREDSYRLLRSDGKSWSISGDELANPPLDQYFPDGMDGLRISITSGTAATGDTFNIQPTRDFADNMSVMITDTAKVAAGSPIRTSGDTVSINVSKDPANTGPANIAAITTITEANGGVQAKKIQLSFTGVDASGNPMYDIKDAATGVVLLGGQTAQQDPVSGSYHITYNGWTVDITGGVPAAGDKFLVDPRRNAGSATISAGAPSGSPLDINLVTQRGAVNRTVSSVAISFNASNATSFHFVDPANGRIFDTKSGNRFDPASGNLLDPNGAVVQGGLSIDPATGNVWDGTNTIIAAQTYTSGSKITFNGWSAQISGVPKGGDTFMFIEANAGAVSDSRNILAIGKLQTANTLQGGTANFQGSYSQMVSQVGVKANQVNINQAAQAQLLKQTQTKLSETSGVNLDEEASNLLVFQQAYLASSRTIQIAQKAFEAVLSIGT
ncbi:flagellar hook-associated protein FlgK [Chitinimonas sp.]|uniref:flagellar hook-associated protein FlgK n=1 Tax=Chitinimonas sp. TaxID=1934313 RepID=UPI0035AE0EB0